MYVYADICLNICMLVWVGEKINQFSLLKLKFYNFKKIYILSDKCKTFVLSLWHLISEFRLKNSFFCPTTKILKFI